MSVILNPSSILSFNRPLTHTVKRALMINNPNDQPVAFKVKTTAPKLYCVRPNSGRIEPGKNVEVIVILQGMKEEPPLNTKCKDKFLIQSTIITPEMDNLSLNDIWNVKEGSEEAKRVRQHKLKVAWVPPEGIIHEEDEGATGTALTDGERQYHTVRQGVPSTNGYADSPPRYLTDNVPPQDESIPHEPATPPADYAASRDIPHDESHPHVEPGMNLPDMSDDMSVKASKPPAVPDVAQMPRPSPSPASIPLPLEPEPGPESQRQEDLAAKYDEALAEIQRLRALLAAAPQTALADSTAPSEVRRRSRRPRSDDGSTIAETEVGTMYPDDHVLQPEGVPLQVVLIIALGVFVTTYLFF